PPFLAGAGRGEEPAREPGPERRAGALSSPLSSRLRGGRMKPPGLPGRRPPGAEGDAEPLPGMLGRLGTPAREGAGSPPGGMERALLPRSPS
ncbi:MAG: hypothetical protein ACXVDI_05425, partial [Ktedonobacterales bacterium]